MPGSPKRCGRCRARASCTCLRGGGPSGGLAFCSSRVSRLRRTQDRPRIASSWRIGCATTRSKRWSPPRRWAWVMTSPTWRFVSTWVRPHRRGRTTSRVGGGGRALGDAQTILGPAGSDERIWDYFATSGIPDEQQVERILDALGDSVQSLAGLEAATGIRRGRLEALLKILAVDDAVRRESGGWAGPGRAVLFS